MNAGNQMIGQSMNTVYLFNFLFSFANQVA